MEHPFAWYLDARQDDFIGPTRARSYLAAQMPLAAKLILLANSPARMHNDLHARSPVSPGGL
jgi:hypothetical protein